MKLTLDQTIYREDGMENERGEILFETDLEIENELVNLYPGIGYQEFEGFGGALTDAAGYVYAQMGDADKKKMLDSYFGKNGMGYTTVRIPVDSCDFSVEQFQAVEDAEDEAFQTFSLEREKKYIYPLWKDVEKAYGKEIEVMLSPWSPPAFMKTNGERSHGGSLKPECRERYAEYLCLYVKKLQEEGFRIKRMSIQNEPKAVQTWDSCIYSAEEEKVFLRDYLYPAMVRNGLENIELFIWDHNKERIFERACAIIDETTDAMIKGIAFHWYSGDHFEAVKLVHEKFPDKKLILSEACIEFSKYSAEGELENVKKYVHDIIGNFNAGMTAFYDWNIVLDGQGGPNHVQNFCDAPYIYHMEEKQLQERYTKSAIGHFSHYLKPGAVRIAFSKYAEELEVTAFRNPDDSLVAVVFNRSDRTLPLTVRVGDECASFEAEGFSVATAVIS